MALIKCPECGGNVSDKAPACIHCGYPLQNVKPITIEDKFNVVLINSGKYGVSLLKQVQALTGLSLASAKELIDYAPNTIVENISKQEAERVKEDLQKMGATIEIEASSIRKERPLSCPRCGSQNVTTGKRGYSIVTGFLGSNKTTNRCGKCGHSWQPR